MNIPSGVDVKIEGTAVIVKGPKGELKRQVPDILNLEFSEKSISIKPKEIYGLDKKTSSLWGLGRAIVLNMIKGVSEGFTKELEFNGVGFKAQIKGSDLELNLGYTNPVVIKGPDGISFKTEKGVIVVSGIDKELVGHVAAQIRKARLPEPYKGTGIKYKDEVIRRKAGKKAVATG